MKYQMIQFTLKLKVLFFNQRLIRLKLNYMEEADYLIHVTPVAYIFFTFQLIFLRIVSNLIQIDF